MNQQGTGKRGDMPNRGSFFGWYIGNFNIHNGKQKTQEVNRPCGVFQDHGTPVKTPFGAGIRHPVLDVEIDQGRNDHHRSAFDDKVDK